jgi:hypothetical protein
MPSWTGLKNYTNNKFQFPNLKICYPLSKYQMDSLALKFSYDMEYYNRHPCEEMEQRQLFCYNLISMTFITEKAVSKRQMSAGFLIPEKSNQIMKWLWIGAQIHLNGFWFHVRDDFHYVTHLQWKPKGMFWIYSWTQTTLSFLKFLVTTIM